ncbi:MAG: pyridoxamine 5'-phosphate oxidase [Anaerolineales bacterium]|nr:pyridoxamine 5'-phosphate oxidase [Anaerolineales bacterium]
MITNPAEARTAWVAHGFDVADAAPEPMDQFAAWLAEVQAAGVFGPRAMLLATADAENRPHARVVMLAGHDRRGPAFATDQRSPKAHDLAAQPWAAAVFLWGEVERQVRFEGPVTRTSKAEADAYFTNRAVGARLATWVGPQSAVVDDRAALEAQLLRTLQEQPSPVPRPPDYVGYRLTPEVVEFWQGRSDRLHDRVRYRRAGGGWLLERLSP